MRVKLVYSLIEFFGGVSGIKTKRKVYRNSLDTRNLKKYYRQEYKTFFTKVMKDYTDSTVQEYAYKKEFLVYTHIWPTGEPLLIPFNSETKCILLHSTQFQWCKYYPFLKNICYKTHTADFNPVNGLTIEEEFSKKYFLESRDHFGHYLYDFYSRMLMTLEIERIEMDIFSLPMKRFNDLFKESIRIAGVESQIYEWSPTKTGFIRFKESSLSSRKSPLPLFVDLLDHGIGKALKGTKVTEKKKNTHPKGCLLLRHADRVSRIPEQIMCLFAEVNKEYTLDILGITKYGIRERIDRLQEYDFIITDIGSTYLNALYFSDAKTVIMPLQTPYCMKYPELFEEVVAAAHDYIPLWAHKRMWPIIGKSMIDGSIARGADHIELPTKFDEASIIDGIREALQVNEN